ncbi:MAG: EamA family transporter [Coriobacteriia bacterium]|nr:EamA family transporter [Coriobacteriia bacterium]MDO9107917.1 EamA family transporter [Coriobacteriia bacterium]
MPALPERLRTDVWRGYALALLAALCWATGGLSAKWLFSPLDALTSTWPVPPPGIAVDPVVLAGARALVAAVLLLAYMAMFRRTELRVPLRSLPFLAAFGIVGLAGVHVTYFQAISHTNVATAILLEYLAPVIVLVFSVLVLGERFTWVLPLGVAISITGCAMVVGAIGGQGLRASAVGVAWGLAAAVFFASYSIMGKFASSHYTPWTLLTWGLLFASAFWLVYLGGLGSVLALLVHPAGLAVVLYMAVFSTIVPFAAFLTALHHIDATKAVVTSTVEPVIAGLAAYLLFGESFTFMQLMGGVLVICAIVVVQRAPGAAAAEELPLAP